MWDAILYSQAHRSNDFSKDPQFLANSTVIKWGNADDLTILYKLTIDTLSMTTLESPHLRHTDLS